MIISKLKLPHFIMFVVSAAFSVGLLITTALTPNTNPYILIAEIIDVLLSIWIIASCEIDYEEPHK